MKVVDRMSKAKDSCKNGEHPSKAVDRIAKVADRLRKAKDSFMKVVDRICKMKDSPQNWSATEQSGG